MEKVEIGDAILYRGDALDVAKTLPDNCVDLIATDPPYFKVKNEDWDRQWDKPQAFLAWLKEHLAEWQRILKPNGSLYVFASPQMAARVEVATAERFNVLNHIAWYKGASINEHSASSAHRSKKEGLRAFFPETERVIFAEHYGADNIAKGESGYQAKCDELRGFVFEPLRAYICGEYERAGMLNTEGKIATNVACGFSASSGGMASRHYFSRSQWCLPTAEHYSAMQQLLNQGGGEYLKREYEYLKREYEDLKREYEDLKREYEDLRRPFSVSAEVPYTDVWTFKTVQGYPGKHPCEKPLDLMEHIIRTSSKEGATVADFFMGSGTTVQAALNLGRKAIGVDKSEHWVSFAADRIEDAQRQALLFA